MEIKFEEKHKCKGYYGFGTGYNLQHGKEGYCNNCPLNDKCWEAHGDRVRQAMPELTAIIDKKSDELNDTHKLMLWIQKNLKGADPYIAVMMGNIEDSKLIELGGKPKHRSFLTLPYPFTEVN